MKREQVAIHGSANGVKRYMDRLNVLEQRRKWHVNVGIPSNHLDMKISDCKEMIRLTCNNLDERIQRRTSLVNRILSTPQGQIDHFRFSTNHQNAQDTLNRGRALL